MRIVLDTDKKTITVPWNYAAKIEELKVYGKTITIFRLFDGKTYESESSNKPYNLTITKPKGGRMT